MITTPLRQRVFVALIASVVLVGLFAVALRLGAGGFAPGYSLVVGFDRVLQGLSVDRSDVKIRGVTVGRVSSIELREDGQVAVTLFIEPEARVPDTTVAAIEPLSVFGPKFIRLDPGAHETTGPFLEDGDIITQTERPVDFLDFITHGARLLEVTNPDDVFVTIHTLAEGLDGLGDRLGDILDASEVVAARASGQSDNLRALLANLARLSQSLASRGEAIATIARDGAGVLTEVAARPDELGELLDHTSRLAGVLAGLIEDNPGAMDKTVLGLTNVVEVLHDDLDGLLALIDALDSFFGNLGRTIHLEFTARPDVRLGVVHSWAFTQVCNIIAGLTCVGPQGPLLGGTSASVLTGGSSAGPLDPLLQMILPVPLSQALLLLEDDAR